jgi:hypothetical protein
MNIIEKLARIIMISLIILFVVLLVNRIKMSFRLWRIKRSDEYNLYISQLKEKKEEISSFKKDSKFFYIPVIRLVYMSIVSLGLYEAYWIYKNWKYFKERYNLRIHPFWRGVFGVFTCHSLMKAIRNDNEVNTIRKARFSAPVLATGWVIFTVLGNILASADDFIVSILGFIIAIPSFLFFLPVQNYINSVNGSILPRPKYDKWSAGHFVCLIIGIIAWGGLIYYVYIAKIYY